MYAQDKAGSRQYFIDTWRKVSAGEALEPLEKMIADIVRQHPEYHALLEDADAALGRDFTPESGAENPFLHMGMHIAIQEQLSTNRPAGIIDLYQALGSQLPSLHEVEHAMMECLGVALWEAQRNATAPDDQAYMECLRKLGSRSR